MVVQTSFERASFATSARLISCLVTESLLRAFYVPLSGVEATAAAIVLSGQVSSEPPYSNGDILAVIPLRHVPIFKHDGDQYSGQEIGLLDPMDMLPMIYYLRDSPGVIATTEDEHSELSKAVKSRLSLPGWSITRNAQLTPSFNPLELWEHVGVSVGVDAGMRKEIAEELESSVVWQAYSYDHPPNCPSFESLSIEWEQSIVEGHPTHPMHKARRAYPPIREIKPGEYDFYHARIRLIAVPRDDLKITHDFENYTRPILERASLNAKQLLQIPEGHVAVPVHDLQIANIAAKFPEAKIFPEEFSVASLAQQSIRSVILPGVFHEHSLKLGFGVKLTSAMRTISPPSAYLGPRFSAQVVPKLTMDHNLLFVAKELASVVHAHPDVEIAKHCAAIIREAHENVSEERGERMIVCTALVESGHANVEGKVPAIIRAFELDNEEKRIEWLDRFVRLFFEAFLPSVIHNGVAFEAHPQNTVARFNLETRKLVGFVIRDFGGLRVHPPTLLTSTGQALDFVEGHSIIADTLDDVYTRLYHTVIHNHLQQLIRVLGLHYNGKGWEIVRRHLRAIIPADHALEKAWLAPEVKTLPGKCFMRMRMSGMYRFHLHGPFPNLIHYTGVNA